MKRTRSTNVLSIHFFCRNHVFLLPAVWKLYCWVFVRNNQCSEKKFIFEEPQTAWESPWCVLWVLLWGFDLTPALLEVSSGLELGLLLVGDLRAEFNTCTNSRFSSQNKEHQAHFSKAQFQLHSAMYQELGCCGGITVVFLCSKCKYQHDSGFEHGSASDS